MSNKFRMELEIEYVRREKVTFVVDPDDGMSQVGVPWEVGRTLRSMQYHLHHGKDLVASEQPRMVGWRVIPRRSGALLGCGCWTYKMSAGQPLGCLVACSAHGNQEAVQMNVDEPDDVYLDDAGLR